MVPLFWNAPAPMLRHILGARAHGSIPGNVNRNQGCCTRDSIRHDFLVDALVGLLLLVFHWYLPRISPGMHTAYPSPLGLAGSLAWLSCSSVPTVLTVCIISSHKVVMPLAHNHSGGQVWLWLYWVSWLYWVQEVIMWRDCNQHLLCSINLSSLVLVMAAHTFLLL